MVGKDLENGFVNQVKSLMSEFGDAPGRHEVGTVQRIYKQSQSYTATEGVLDEVSLTCL